MTAEERFWSKVDQAGDCWIWTSTVTSRGYGHFHLGGKDVYAHRLAYEWMVGPIPAGLYLDHRHTCPKNCVNPDHLRPATMKQNLENRAGAQVNSASGVRGVWWRRDKQRWIAEVKHHGQKVHVGSFKELEEARAAVIAKRNELFTHNDADRGAA